MAPGSASRAVAAGGGPDRPPGVGATGAARHADRSRRVAALALFAGALAVRAIAWARTAVLFDDGPQFLAIAAALREGDWSTALAHPYHPLYPIAVAALSPGAGDPEAVAAGLSIVCGGLAVLAFFLWLDDAFDRRVAVVGGLLLALHPFAVEFSSDVQSDGLYLALFLGAFASIARALRTRRL